MNKRIALIVFALLVACACVFVACDGIEDVTGIVKFDANGGTTNATDLTLALGTDVDLADYTCQREGYDFVGWSVDGKTVTSFMLEKNTTVVAVWSPVPYISCNAETAEIVNDVITFNAAAYAEDEKLDVEVRFGDEVLAAQTDGVYVAELSLGTNTFYLKANFGERIVEKTCVVEYEGFTVQTTDVVTGDENYDFKFSALYGSDKCDVELTAASGATVSAKRNDMFTLAFSADGVYAVTVKAIKDNKSYVSTFDVTYDGSLPKFKLMNLDRDKNYRGDKVAFNLIAADKDGNKLDDSDVHFYADYDADDGTDEFVELTDAELDVIWSDSITTSYALYLAQGGYADSFATKTALKVQLVDGNKTVERLYYITYVGPDEDGCVGEVVVSIDGFTVGVGYILQPTVVKVYKDVPFPQTLADIIESNGWTMDYTGKLEAGFYLATLYGLDLANNQVDQRLNAILDENGMGVSDQTISPEDDGTYALGEFCFSFMSGWMYSVNGVYANYGMSDYTPVDGDVVQLRFTLAYGSDVGGASAMGGFMPDLCENNPDYIALNKLLAEIVANDYYGKDSGVFDEVLAEVAVWDLPQSVVDEAYGTLESTYLA